MSKVHAVMITGGQRLELVQQTLFSLQQGASTATLVIDGADIGTWNVTRSTQVVEINRPVCIIGLLKNTGAMMCRATFEPSLDDYIYFCDDDVYHRPGWVQRMTAAMHCLGDEVGILGGCRHPFHKVNSETDLAGMVFQETDAVAGYSMLMKYSTWLKYGPFDAHAKGTGQSEDWALCQKVREAGRKVGYLSPSPVLHCGLTGSNGVSVPGWEQMEKCTEEEKKAGVVQL